MRSECPQWRKEAAITGEPLSEAEQCIVEAVKAAYPGPFAGYMIPEAERDAINSVASSDTYGELQPVATVKLLRLLMLTPEDVFFDLGCGTGRVLLSVALGSDVRRIVGLELSETRVNIARAAIERTGVAARCAVFTEDLVVAPRLAEATVCYCCTTTMPKPTLAALTLRLIELPRLRLLAILNNPFLQIPEVRDRFRGAFRAAGWVNLDTSWAPNVRIHMYRRWSASDDAGEGVGAAAKGKAR